MSSNRWLYCTPNRQSKHMVVLPFRNLLSSFITSYAGKHDSAWLFHAQECSEMYYYLIFSLKEGYNIAHTCGSSKYSVLSIIYAAVFIHCNTHSVYRTFYGLASLLQILGWTSSYYWPQLWLELSPAPAWVALVVVLERIEVARILPNLCIADAGGDIVANTTGTAIVTTYDGISLYNWGKPRKYCCLKKGHTLERLMKITEGDTDFY